MSGFEVLGAVTAAGQFIEQSIKVIQLIKGVHDKVHNAPTEIEKWTQEIETLVDIARKVQRTSVLQTPEIQAILSRCDDRIRNLSDIFNSISWEADASLGKKTWLAFRGVGQEAKIRGIFEDLEREKSSLDIYIGTATL